MDATDRLAEGLADGGARGALRDLPLWARAARAALWCGAALAGVLASRALRRSR